MNDNYKKYLIFNDGYGKDVLNELKSKYRRKTMSDPIDTHMVNIQADVVEFIDNCLQTAIKIQRKK